MNASEFKAKCLAVLDEVSRTGQPITILKRGKPVAQLTAPAPGKQGFPQHELIGKGEILGDVIEPVLPAEAWSAERGEER